MKFLLLVADGMGDIGKETPLSQAKKPNMELLAKNGWCGLLDIGYGKTVNSDFGFLNILGCYSKEEYPGRGYLEALGVGLKPGQKDICIRGNFATLDARGMLIDRRAGRDETGLEEFALKLDGMEIDGVKFTVKKSAGHRVVLVLEGKNLSDQIIPNDPLNVNVPLPQVKAGEEKAKFTASVLNKFVARSHKILAKEPVNKKRKLPANVILIRNSGKKKTVSGFKERFGLRACCIAGIPIAKGVSRFLDMDVIDVPGATGMPDTDLPGKIQAVINTIEKYDLVFLHINGTDILSHDAKRTEKKNFIERIDEEIGKVLKRNLRDLIIIITCDHRTVSLPEFKKYRHLPDPVPVLVSGNGAKPDGIDTFNENSCKRGFRIKGNELISLLLRKTKNL